jgi:hypothetical protein
LLGAAAEFERALIRERTQAGQARYRQGFESGRVVGKIVSSRSGRNMPPHRPRKVFDREEFSLRHVRSEELFPAPTQGTLQCFDTFHGQAVEPPRFLSTFPTSPRTPRYAATRWGFSGLHAGSEVLNCEIEFLPVGDGSKAGDAIVQHQASSAYFSETARLCSYSGRRRSKTSAF